jgi:hypothetical protein
MQAEADNPQAPSASEMNDIRTAMTSWVADTAELATAGAIEDARGFAGVAGAITAFQSGQTLAGLGDLSGALTEWESAYAQALSARETGPPGPDTPLPFQVVSSPRFFATVEGRRYAFISGLIGSGAPVSVQIQNAPPGAVVQTQPAGDPSAPAFVTDLDLSATPPGTYAFELEAADGTSFSSDSLQVVVAPAAAPVPALGGPARVALVVLSAWIALLGFRPRRGTAPG